MNGNKSTETTCGPVDRLKTTIQYRIVHPPILQAVMYETKVHSTVHPRARMKPNGRSRVKLKYSTAQHSTVHPKYSTAQHSTVHPPTRVSRKKSKYATLHPGTGGPVPREAQQPALHRRAWLRNKLALQGA